MSNICPTCIVLDCADISEFTQYNLQSNVLTSQELSFVINDLTITVPAGFFTVVLPVTDSAGSPPGATPLVLQCCESFLTAQIPEGTSADGVLALARSLIYQCAQQQSRCIYATL